MTSKSANIHAPMRLAQIECCQHSRSLVLHALKTSLNVSRPFRVTVALRPEIVVAIDGPDAQIGVSALTLVEHPSHIKKLEVAKVIYLAAANWPIGVRMIGLIIPPGNHASIEGRLKMLPVPSTRLRIAKTQIANRRALFQRWLVRIPQSMCFCIRGRLVHLIGAILLKNPNSRLEDSGQFYALGPQGACKFPAGTVGKFIRRLISRSRGTVPTPLAIIVLAPRLPVIIQDEGINWDVFL